MDLTLNKIKMKHADCESSRFGDISDIIFLSVVCFFLNLYDRYPQRISKAIDREQTRQSH